VATATTTAAAATIIHGRLFAGLTPAGTAALVSALAVVTTVGVALPPPVTLPL